MAFRGTVDRLHAAHNGNFLGLVQLLGQYDPTMKEHLRKIDSKEIHNHYLGKTIQNDLINLLGSEIQSSIISNCKVSKYFSIILDCTPDKSHVEQMSFTLRFVDISGVK